MTTKRIINIMECIGFYDETESNFVFNMKDARRALKKAHIIMAIVTKTDEGRMRTSPIISINKKYIETKNSFYVFS